MALHASESLIKDSIVAVTENLLEQLFATDDDRSESERSVINEIEAESNKNLDQNIEDPTQKASNMLIKSLLDEQKRIHKKNVCNVKHKSKHVSSLARSSVKIPKKIRLPKIPIKPKMSGENLEFEEENTARNTETREKQKKIAIIDDIPNGFGCLSLQRLGKRVLPDIFFQIEKGLGRAQAKEILTSMEQKQSESTTNLSAYIEFYRAMLNMEEAAETLNIQKYNQRSVQLAYSNFGNKFEIKKDVRFIIQDTFSKSCSKY